jgi:hypothetical protein
MHVEHMSASHDLLHPGWQDTGSTFTVRCSSRLQPEVESEFVVEQLVLAPDSWPADALRLFNLDMDIQVGLKCSNNHHPPPAMISM